MGDVMDGTSFVGGEAGGRDTGRVSELTAIVSGDGAEDGGEGLSTEATFQAIEGTNDLLRAFTFEAQDDLKAGNALREDEEGDVGTTGTDDTIHLEVTEVFALLNLLGTILDTDSPGMVMGEAFMNRFFTFLARALNHITGGETDNDALMNVVVDSTGAERALDAVSDEYLTGGIRGVLEFSAHKLSELRGELVIGADL